MTSHCFLKNELQDGLFLSQKSPACCLNLNIIWSYFFFWPLGHNWNRCAFATGHGSGKLCQSTMRSLWNISVLPEAWLLQAGILKKALWTGFQVIDRKNLKKNLYICLILPSENCILSPTSEQAVWNNCCWQWSGFAHVQRGADLWVLRRSGFFKQIVLHVNKVNISNVKCALTWSVSGNAVPTNWLSNGGEGGVRRRYGARLCWRTASWHRQRCQEWKNMLCNSLALPST